MGADDIMRIATWVFNENFKMCHDIREDLIEEGIVAIVRADKNFDESRGVAKITYLYECARGQMLKFYNKEKARKQTFVALPDGEIVRDKKYDFIEKINNREELTLLYKMLCGLKEKDKYVVCKYLEGKSHAEIAMELNVSRQAVNSRWKKILNNLRNEFYTRRGR